METARFRTLMRPFVGMLLLPLLVGACGESASTVSEPTTDGETQSTLSVFLTDAPGDVSRVWVRVDDVVLVGDDEQISLLDESTDLIELTSLEDRATTLVNEEPVDPGAFEQLRFILGGGVLETTDAEGNIDGVFTFDADHPEGEEATGQLLCPSCEETGIKVRLTEDVVIEDGENGVLLDFDVSQSLGRQAGRSGMWVMRPVINGAPADPDEARQDGRPGIDIVGAVELADGVTIPECPAGEERSLEDFIPLATAQNLTDEDGNAVQLSGETDEDGSYEIKVLEPDDYDLSFVESSTVDGAELVFGATIDPAVVTVEDGDDEVAGGTYTVESASCETG